MQSKAIAFSSNVYGLSDLGLTISIQQTKKGDHCEIQEGEEDREMLKRDTDGRETKNDEDERRNQVNRNASRFHDEDSTDIDVQVAPVRVRARVRVRVRANPTSRTV